MNILKTRSYKWWQLGLLKLSLLSIGVAIGSYWQDLFLPYISYVLTIGIILAIYSIGVAMRQ